MIFGGWPYISNIVGTSIFISQFNFPISDRGFAGGLDLPGKSEPSEAKLDDLGFKLV